MMTSVAQRPPQYINSITTLDASRLDSRDVITLYGPVSQVWDGKLLARRTGPTVGGSWWNSRVHTPDYQAGNGALTQLLTGSPWLSSATSTGTSQLPHETKGWLYYYRPPSRPPTAGEVRFRLLPPTGKFNFASGTDLSLRSGRLPYAIRLMDIATKINYRMLANVLLRDQLVSQDLLERCKKQTDVHFVRRTSQQFFFHIEDPFILNLSNSTFTPYVWLDEDLVRSPRLRDQWRDSRKHMPSPTYTGERAKTTGGPAY